jgi:hypothetical protein
VASLSLGRAGGFGFMVAVARAWVWVGVAAWAAVMLAMSIALARALSGGTRGRPPSPVCSAEGDEHRLSSNN